MAAKWSPKSFQEVYYLQHNLCDISALIKKSPERRSEIPPRSQTEGTALPEPNPATAPKPPPGCCELLPLPCFRLFWCPCLAESCPNAVITRSDSFCADLVFWNGTCLCSQRCRFWGWARKLQDKEGKTKQTKTQTKERKKSFLVQHLLSHRTLYFPLCIIFLKYNHILHKEIM